MVDVAPGFWYSPCQAFQAVWHSRPSLQLSRISEQVKPTCRVPDKLGPLSASSEEGNGNPLQYSCLENPMDRGAW